MPQEETRGGADRGQGRKSIPENEKKKPKTIRLYPWQLEKLKDNGITLQQAVDLFIEDLSKE